MAKILYVDDDLKMSGMVEDWLVYEKHSVDVVHTGYEGWQKASANQYDLLILDWDLPDLNGIDILKRFRSSDGTTPVLMLTGHTSVDDKMLGLDSGADDYLTKPFHMGELSARVRAALRRGEQQAPVLRPLGSGNEEVLKRAELAGSLLATRYEFLDVLGEGGLGLVFRARHPIMEKLVAIKMLHAHELKDESVERFIREGKAISRLDHQNIVTIYDFGVTERKQPFMVMELIEGVNLAALGSEEGALPVDQALDICIQAAAGIAHAHEMDILHRDIKPSNLMLKQYGGRPSIVKILDFGLAKLKSGNSGKPIDLTQVGQIIGSPPYMSPEQVKGTEQDERSDIYSLGCVLYEALTGCPPHMGETAMEVMIKHLQAPPLSLQELRPDLDLPVELEQIVAKALAKDPDERYQSMHDFKHDLAQSRAKFGTSAG